MTFGRLKRVRQQAGIRSRGMPWPLVTVATLIGLLFMHGFSGDHDPAIAANDTAMTAMVKTTGTTQATGIMTGPFRPADAAAFADNTASTHGAGPTTNMAPVHAGIVSAGAAGASMSHHSECVATIPVRSPAAVPALYGIGSFAATNVTPCRALLIQWPARGSPASLTRLSISRT